MLYVVKIMGKATTSVFSHNIEGLKSNIINIILALIITILVIPIIDLFWKKRLVDVGCEFDSFVYNEFLKQKRDIIDKNDLGNLIYRIEYNPVNYRMKILNVVGDGISYLIIIIIIMLTMIRIDIKYSLICLILSISPISIVLLTKKIVKKYYENNEKYKENILNKENRIIESLMFIKINNLRTYVLNFYRSFFGNYINVFYKKKLIYENLIYYINNIYNLICKILIYIIGGYYLAKNQITIGDIVVFLGLSPILQENFGKIVDAVKFFLELKVASKQVHELTDNIEDNGKIDVGYIERIDFDKVSFGYNDKTVLNNMSFSIRKNDIVVIKGNNGSGKSTILKLIAGFYSNYEGEIKINNVNIKNLNKKLLRNNLTWITQMPCIFDKSIYDNILDGIDSKDFVKIEEYLRIFNLYEIKDKMCGEEGKYLSGGERQKVCLIKALIRQTSLIILDEPDNNLDSESRNKFISYLNNLNKILIIIAHNEEWDSIANYELKI